MFDILPPNMVGFSGYLWWGNCISGDLIVAVLQWCRRVQPQGSHLSWQPFILNLKSLPHILCSSNISEKDRAQRQSTWRPNICTLGNFGVLVKTEKNTGSKTGISRLEAGFSSASLGETPASSSHWKNHHSKNGTVAILSKRFVHWFSCGASRLPGGH